MDQQALSPIKSTAAPAVPFGVSGGNGLFHRRHPGGYISLNDIMQPEFLLPVQYDDMIRRRIIRDGERRLLLAVLKDGLRCYLKSMNGRSAHARRDFEETAYWFFAEHQEGIFAFEQICEALGIEPEPLRAWLRSLHADTRGPALHGAAPSGRNGGRARDFMKSRLVLA
jgi:hypothetical protein